MAKKSKTQKAKASAARQARKAEREVEAIEAAEDAKPEAAEASDQAEKKAGLKKAEANKPEKTKPEAKKADKPKKKRFQFLREVRGELKRVTWPTKKDVGQWTGVVVAALLFFGIYVAILDNLIITPALIGVSSIEVEQPAPALESSGGEGNVGIQTTDSSAEGEAAAEDAADATADTAAEDGAADDGADEGAASEGSEG